MSAGSTPRNWSIGTINGGSLTMRISPFSVVVSLSKARMLFLRSALATFFSKFFAWLWLTCERYCSKACTSRRSYQTSIVRIEASRRISSRYSRAAAATADRVSLP